MTEKIQRKTVAVYSSPGTFFNEESRQDIGNGEISAQLREAVAKAGNIRERYGARPFAFYLVEYLTAPPVDDGEGGFLEVVPKEVSRTGPYFLGGSVVRFDDIATTKETCILRGNLRGNGWPWMIVTNQGNRQPFEKCAAIVDPDTAEVLVRGTDADIEEYRSKKLSEWSAVHGEA